MADWCPPYISRLVEKLQKAFIKAERKELKAKKKYEYAVEYCKLCKAQFDKALADEKK